MRHRCTRRRQDLQISLGVPMNPRVLIDNQTMTKDCLRAEHADRFGPLDGRNPMAPCHLVEFKYALRCVSRERRFFLGRVGNAVAQQLFSHGFDGAAAQNPPHAAGFVVGLELFDRRNRLFEIAPPACLVPNELQLVPVFKLPTR